MLPLQRKAHLLSGPAVRDGDPLARSDVPGPPWPPMSHASCSACCADNLECPAPGPAGSPLAPLDAWSCGGDHCGPDYSLWSQNAEQSHYGSQCFPEERSWQNFFHSEWEVPLMPKRATLTIILLESVIAADERRLSISSQTSVLPHCKPSHLDWSVPHLTCDVLSPQS